MQKRWLVDELPLSGFLLSLVEFKRRTGFGRLLTATVINFLPLSIV
jgi:hypothetical protein